MSGSDFSVHNWPKAAKDHRCEWCGEPIPKGERHYQYTGIWQGEWQYWRMHEECREQSQLDDAYDEGFSPFENERPRPAPVLDGVCAS
jgi:hypothetical protein